MSESIKPAQTVIPEALMLIRLAQSEQLREFFIQIWKQNPKLASQGGIKVQNLMSPLDHVDRVISRASPAGYKHESKGASQ